MDQQAGKRVVSRVSSRAGTIAAVSSAALAVVVLGVDPRSWFLIPLVVTAVWFAWVGIVFPRVEISPGEAHVRNSFVSWTVPFDDVFYASSGIVLRIRMKSGPHITVFGASGQSGLGMDAIRSANTYAHTIVPVRRVGDLAPQLTKTQAAYVAKLLNDRATETPAAERAATRTANVSIIAISGLLVTASLVAASVYQFGVGR